MWKSNVFLGFSSIANCNVVILERISGYTSPGGSCSQSQVTEAGGTLQVGGQSDKHSEFSPTLATKGDLTSNKSFWNF